MGYSDDLQPISPPKKIQQDGYEYSLVGPVKPEWLVDGVWVVRKDNGYIHQVKETKPGIFHLTTDGEYSIRVTHHIYGQYRPFTNSDWKWGMWAEYAGRKVFVIRVGSQGTAVITSQSSNSVIDYVPVSELTPTF